jgi:hypothetical protein
MRIDFPRGSRSSVLFWRYTELHDKSDGEVVMGRPIEEGFAELDVEALRAE